MTEPSTGNRRLVEDFVELFYRQRKIREAFESYVREDYIQHNPNIGDGREPAILMLEPKFLNAAASFDIKRILIDGDYAVIHLHAKLGLDHPGAAVVDMYRLQDGKIVEHWDVLQLVPANSVNPHPMF